MALTPREQHEWYLITKRINEEGGLRDPKTDDDNEIAWRYLLSAGYIVFGLVATAYLLFSGSAILSPLGLGVVAMGVLHFKRTFDHDITRRLPVPIHKSRDEGNRYGL